MPHRNSISRRSFLKGVAGFGALAALGTANAYASPSTTASSSSRAQVSAWIWQFDVDGNPIKIRQQAASRKMRVIVKSHDGLDWMSKWDTSSDAVTGPDQVRVLQRFFKTKDVPMDAWCVPTGEDPIAEAEMCSQVLDAGAERLYLDLEKGEDGSFWYGSGEDAMRFGLELRKRHPDARLIVAPDARPWQTDAVPLREFAAFCDEIAPQSYWKLFNTQTNFDYMTQAGFRPGPDGVTPELMVDVTLETFARYGRTVSPIGDGEASATEWSRFMRKASLRRVGAVSVWRFGLPAPDVWDSIAAPEQDDPTTLVEAARKFLISLPR